MKLENVGQGDDRSKNDDRDRAGNAKGCRPQLARDPTGSVMVGLTTPVRSDRVPASSLPSIRGAASAGVEPVYMSTLATFAIAITMKTITIIVSIAPSSHWVVGVVDTT